MGGGGGEIEECWGGGGYSYPVILSSGLLLQIFFRSPIEPINGIYLNSLSTPPPPPPSFYRLKRRQKTRNKSYANYRWTAGASKRINSYSPHISTLRDNRLSERDARFFQALTFFFSFIRSSKLSEHLIQIAPT